MALTINIIGAGNLAYHLTKALYTTPNVHLQQLIFLLFALPTSPS